MNEIIAKREFFLMNAKEIASEYQGLVEDCGSNNSEIISKNNQNLVNAVNLAMDLYDAARLVSLISISPKFCIYLNQFLKKSLIQNKETLLILNIKAPQKYSIDYIWDRKVLLLVNENCEVQNAMAWLSTLGGGYSSLGDNLTSFAEEAEKISYKQLILALRVGDPATISRCYIYIAISLLQRGYLKAAKQIILEQYAFAKSQVEDGDSRLPKMCKGVWSKLQYLKTCKNNKLCSQSDLK